MRPTFGDQRSSTLTPRRACLVLGGACAGIVVAAALIVLAVVVSASTAVIEFENAAAVLIGIFATRVLRPAVVTLRGSWRPGNGSKLAELRRQLAALPETPHPLGL